MKLGLLTLTVLTAAIAGNASAQQLRGSPYTFSGSTVSASASCPYAAKSKLAGYTLISQSYEYVYKPPNSYTRKAIISGPALIFSPGGTADKLVMKLGQLPDHSGAISGKGDVVRLPGTGSYAASYTGSVTLNADKSFKLIYTMTYKEAGKTCTAKYDLDFKKGLPSNLFKLL